MNPFVSSMHSSTHKDLVDTCSVQGLVGGASTQTDGKACVPACLESAVWWPGGNLSRYLLVQVIGDLGIGARRKERMQRGCRSWTGRALLGR